jgi:hypothetical protein
VRRTQGHPAELPVGRLADLAASLQRFQLVKDAIHGHVAPCEDRVADEGLDAFNEGGFKKHGDSTSNEQLNHNDELSDLLSIVCASRIPKQPVASDRDAAASPPLPDALPPPGPPLVRARAKRSWSTRDQAGGPWGTIRQFVDNTGTSRPSRMARQRVEGRTRHRFRLSWWIDRVIAPRTDGGGSGSSSSRVGRRGAPWANCCLWTTTRT